MAPQVKRPPVNWKPLARITGLGCVVGTGYTCYSFYTWRQENRIRGVSRSPSQPPISFEVLRTPCERLLGYDVVVRHAFAEPEKSYAEEQIVSDKDRTRIGRFFHRLYLLYFTNELDDINSSRAYEDVAEDEQFSTKNIRKVVSSSNSSVVSVPDRPLDGRVAALPYNDNINTHTNNNNNEQAAPTVSTWPRGTHLFASMTIEPTRGGASSKGIQSMLDSSTEQTLSKCMSNGRFRKDPNHCTADPTSLLSPYLRVMLGAFAFFSFPIPGPLRVCQLGVGGGAMPMFLQQHLGSVIGQLDLVDIEPAVLRAAVEKMGLEKINRVGEMRMCAEDGAVFLEKVAEASNARRVGKGAGRGGTIPANSSFLPYDVIMIDLFVGSRLPPFLDNPADALGFAEMCRDALTPQGVVAFNMPHRMPEFEAVCQKAFGDKRVFALPCSPNSNVVYVATKSFNDSSMFSMNKRHVVRRCSELSQRYHFPFDVSASLPLSWWVW